MKDTSVAQVSLCAGCDLLYLVWAGRDENHSINVLQSSDGKHWDRKVTLGDSTTHTPALAATSPHELILGWTGRDPQGHLNTMVSTEGSNGFRDKLTLDDTAVSGVSLATLRGGLFVAWDGTDAGHHINVMQL